MQSQQDLDALHVYDNHEEVGTGNSRAQRFSQNCAWEKSTLDRIFRTVSCPLPGQATQATCMYVLYPSGDRNQTWWFENHTANNTRISSLALVCFTTSLLHRIMSSPPGNVKIRNMKSIMVNPFVNFVRLAAVNLTTGSTSQTSCRSRWCREDIQIFISAGCYEERTQYLEKTKCMGRTQNQCGLEPRREADLMQLLEPQSRRFHFFRAHFLMD